MFLIVNCKKFCTSMPHRPIHKILYRSCSSMLTEAKLKLKSKGEGTVHLQIDNERNFATITIENIKKRNAISGSMMIQLEEVITELETWKAGKGVLLKAAGNIFCSGLDISGISQESSDYGMTIATFMHNALTRLYCLPMVTVTLVRGKAIGGGAELTTATDFRLFAPSASISFIQGKMGVVTGWGGGTRLVKLLGPKTALELLTTSKTLTGMEALRIGFADQLFSEEDGEKLAVEFLLERIKYDNTIVRAMKQIIVGARDSSLHESLLNEQKIFSPLWGGPANIKALKANIKHK